MKMMCIGDWSDRCSLSEIGGAFASLGDQFPEEGMTRIARWHNVSAKRFFLVVEVDDTSVFETWAAKWANYFDLSIFPVLDDEEIVAVLGNALAGSE